ncbi:MAG: TIGR00282 family metallophosphoesterase [Proteobacteria bacterium]|nr:TIGR00282 family metallophosphoesterase [Pseudomonadota bacterium]
MSFNILAFGDVIGRPGRDALEQALESIKSSHKVDFIIVNGENAAGGFGLTRKIFDQFIGPMEIDCVTTGNHWMDKREIYDFMDHERLVLPGNMSNVDDQKQGWRIIRSRSGVNVAVINLLGKIFMIGDNRSPYDTVEKILSRIPPSVKIRVVDMHAEATSEKQGMAHLVSGQVSVVYGTHSHVPTADLRILKDFTGYVTDLGMTGGYDSVIGMDANAAVRRMRTGVKKDFEPAKGNPLSYACLFEIDENSGACTRVERLRFPMDRG